MSAPTAYKPSPLSYGSPPTRSSPFKRAESPASPSPLRHTTPTGSPTKGAPGRFSETSRLARPTTPTSSTQETWTPRAQQSPSREMASSPRQAPRATVSKPLGHGNALSQLQPAQVRTLRDGFQILDRDCDGVVNRDDVADMLNQLGLPSSSSDVSQFFPPSAPQTIALAAFLNSLAEKLAALSPPAELLSAFSAFDDDDSGQANVAELRDALLNTAPEPGERALTAAEVDKVLEGFTGRRAFNRNMNAQLGAKRGDVFKYQEFVNSLSGPANGSSEGGSRDASEG